MKRWLYILLWGWAAAVGAVEFEEGRNYHELPFPQPTETGARIEVREYFWYGCPHCYTFEPEIERWLKTKPKNIEFTRTPWTAPRGLIHAQAYLAFIAAGMYGKMHGPFFAAVQKQHSDLDNEAGIAQFVAKHGGDPVKFSAAYNSFGVQLELAKAKRLNEMQDIHSVPMLVVDGRYATSPALAGGPAQVWRLIEHLVQKTARERPRGVPKG